MQSRTKDIPKLIFPSNFRNVLSTLEELQHANNLQYVLSYDGKNVSQGFKGTNFGDVDLWGFEGPPSLKDHEQRLLNDLEVIDDVTQTLNPDNRSTILENLHGLLSVITLCIKDL